MAFGKFKNNRKNKESNKKNLINIKSMDLTTSSISGESILAAQKKLPILGNFSVNNQYKILAIMGVIGVLGMVLSGVQYGSAINNESNLIKNATTLSTEVNKIEELYSNSLDRDTEAYNKLIGLSNNIVAQFQNLQTSTHKINDEVLSIYKVIADNLNKINNNIGILSKQPNLMINEAELVNTLNQRIEQLNLSLKNYSLLYDSNLVTKNDVSSINHLQDNSNRINLLLTNILLSKEVSLDKVNELRKAQEEFLSILNTLSKTNSEAAALYSNIEKEWLNISNNVSAIYSIYTNSVTEQLLKEQTNTYINNIVTKINELSEVYKGSDLSGVHITQYYFFISLFLLLFSIFLIFISYMYNTHNRGLIEKLEYSRNQNSIMQLITEMMPLQDGDLTKKTTVSDEITGAIADFINATIDSLASLVKKIKDTSFVMGDKTNEVNGLASKMLSITDQQTNSLNKVGQTVSEITDAISEISDKTEESVKQAKKSVEISELGSQQVQNSVLAMQEINKNMEETVLLMKKVDSSSKQISEIVELLSDITEQTSILALNATIQATRAGEKGKGFKIVADSIQELADKASEAARRVGALISAAQNDIKAVDIAVKKTTQEVDKGVKLSESAGESLEQITTASKELSALVHKVSQDARRYANYAKTVNDDMKELLTITEENKESSKETVEAIKEISEISSELRDSVHSFKIED